MSETLKPNFLPILRVLSNHKVDFILVGGVAAVIQGAPIMTFDVDVLYGTAPVNLTRLLAAIAELDGYYRLQPERRLRRQLSHLAAGGHNLLVTKFGPLDLLGTVGNARTYESLLASTVLKDLGEGVTIPVLNLEIVIAVKEETAGEKDRAMLPILRRTLEESRRR